MLEPVVDIQELSFTYSGSEVPALERINLRVYPGQFITITGPSGCGKSTLALCLAGFIPHAYAGKMEGTIYIQGRNTRDYPAGGLSGIVGLVQQDPEAQLCTLTVKDEVAFGPENLCIPSEEIRERILFALEAVGAIDLKDRQLHTLSGGEKQRVAIASVLAMTPSLLILDEPTANLDPSCTREVLETLRRLKEQHQISIIVIEHRLERLVSISDHLLLMQRGRIVDEGKPESFRRLFSPVGKRIKAEIGLPEEGSSSIRKQAQKVPVLSVKNLTAGYAGRDVLSGISFSAYEGETIAVMGDNGSGKTTLLLALLGIINAREGAIYLQGKDITRQKVSRRAQYMGLAFQNPNHQIFEDTVLKEAALASSFLGRDTPHETEQRVVQLLEEFGLKQYENKNPFTLSLGEKKRLALLSLLAYMPRILILDEPLVGQDSDRVELLINALREHRARGGITLMVCHEPNMVVSCCQRILFLSKGKLIIDRPVEEALRRMAELGWDEYLPAGYQRTVWRDRIGKADELLS
jgi:energy-coupling factor transport system ATP-binding protein